MQIHQRIRALREARGLSQEDLAHRVGYRDRSSIAKVEAGLVDLSQGRLTAIAAALEVTPTQLIQSAEDVPLPDNVSPIPELRRLPLLGTIACGQPVLAESNLDGLVDVPATIHADFALRCQGDSMINARIFDGDIVYIRQQETVENGEIAAVLIGEEATLKRVRLFDDHIALEPENPQYRPLVYWGDEMSAIRILGKAVAFTGAVR